MEINRHNYEAYLLDLLEGSLSVDEQQLLRNFLLLNPDCGVELTEIEPWILDSEEISFQNSQLLKKELPTPATILTDHNFELFSIARMEGDLSVEQEAAHQAMVEADDQNAQLWDVWQRTRIVPDPIQFQAKDKLLRKKSLKNRVVWISVISAAAAIALLFILFRTGTDLPELELYTQNPQDIVPEPVMDVPVQEEIQPESLEAAENYSPETTIDPPLQTGKDLVLFSVRKVNDRPLELDSKEDAEPHDDLEPRQISFATNQFNGVSAADQAVPDEIEPLIVPPVPVHLSSLTVAQISELDLQGMLEDYTEKKDISLWKIANAGIKGINKVAGSDISLLAARDEEGEVSGFRLKSKRFSLTRPLDREE